MRHALSLALLALVLAAIPLACGEDEISPEAAVAQAAINTSEANTYRTSMTGTMTGFAPETLRMSGTGEVDSARQRSRLALDYEVQGQTLEFEAAMDGSLMYMRFPPELTGELPRGKTWVMFDLQEVGEEMGLDFQQLMQAGQADPSQGLQYLRGATGVKTVGEETVRGIETTHYRGTIEYRRVAQKSPELKESLDRLVELTGVERVPTEVWVDDEGLVRRMRLDYQDMRFAPGQPRGDMTMTMELFDFGVAVDVEPPPDDEVVDMQKLLEKAQ